jgi:hypothetical protein
MIRLALLKKLLQRQSGWLSCCLRLEYDTGCTPTADYSREKQKH